MKKSILFFSRGRGHGHAIPDMALADALLARDPEVSVRFASYSTGANTLRAANRDVIDMNLPEANPFMDTLLAAHEIIRSQSPAMIVAHEEFAALAAAALLKVPSVFVSAWLPSSKTIGAETLRYCRGIIVIERPGIFPVPTSVRTKLAWVGPLVRPLAFTAKDRSVLRRELGWSDDTFSVVVVPGGASKEAESPISDLVLSAFYQLGKPDSKLTWVASSEFDLINARLKGLQGVEVIRYVSPIEKLLGAADVVITKGTRGITYDSAAVGVPSVSISHGRNPADDAIVPRVSNNSALSASAVDPGVLATVLLEAAAVRRDGEPFIQAGRRALEMAVAGIHDILLDVTSDSQTDAR